MDLGGNINLLRVLFSLIPGWLIGITIGYWTGEFEFFLATPVISVLLIAVSYLPCIIFGGIIVLLIEQILYFALMRLDFDVSSSSIDDLLIVIISIVISTYIFQNSVATTVAVTTVTLLHKFIYSANIVTSKQTLITSKQLQRIIFNLVYPL